MLRLRDLVTGALSAPYVAVDPGLEFAAPIGDFARLFDGTHATRRDEPARRVLLEIEARRALCVASPEHRDAASVARLHGDSIARGAAGQVVLPPGSRFRISEHVGVDELGWHRVRCEQVLAGSG